MRLQPNDAAPNAPKIRLMDVDPRAFAEEAGRILSVILPRSEAALGLDHPTTREARRLLELALPDTGSVGSWPAESLERAP